MIIIIILFILGLILDINNGEFGICILTAIVGFLIAWALPVQIEKTVITYNILPISDSSNYYIGIDKTKSLSDYYIRYDVNIDSINGYSYKKIHISDVINEIYVKENFKVVEQKDVKTKSIFNWFAIDFDFNDKYILYIPKNSFDGNFDLK